MQNGLGLWSFEIAQLLLQNLDTMNNDITVDS